GPSGPGGPGGPGGPWPGRLSTARPGRRPPRSGRTGALRPPVPPAVKRPATGPAPPTRRRSCGGEAVGRPRAESEGRPSPPRRHARRPRRPKGGRTRARSALKLRLRPREARPTVVSRDRAERLRRARALALKTAAAPARETRRRCGRTHPEGGPRALRAPKGRPPPRRPPPTEGAAALARSRAPSSHGTPIPPPHPLQRRPNLLARARLPDRRHHERAGEGAQPLRRHDGRAVDRLPDLARVDVDESADRLALGAQFSRERLPDGPGAPRDHALRS